MSRRMKSDWQTLLSVRDEALKALEAARNEKRIGGGLEAQIHLAAPESIYPVLDRYRDQLRYLFIVSGRRSGESSRRATATQG